MAEPQFTKSTLVRLVPSAMTEPKSAIIIECEVPGSPRLFSPVHTTCSEVSKQLDSEQQLASQIRALTFKHAPYAPYQQQPPLAHGRQAALDTEEVLAQREKCWAEAANLITRCQGLQTLKWDLGFGLGGSLWKVISECRNLKSLLLSCPESTVYPSLSPGTMFPRITPDLQDAACNQKEGEPQPKSVGQGNLTLGLAWDSLEHLTLTGLSQNGAKTITTHLQLLDVTNSRLAHLEISTHFLDLGLTTAIGHLGSFGVLKHLALQTSGTRLNAEALQEIMRNCIALESFVLRDGEGRLEKDTWKQIDEWPASLQSIEIEIAESTPHHSWVLSHLSTIHYVPLEQLSRFAVRRIVHPLALLPFPLPNLVVPPVTPGNESAVISPSLLEAIISSGQNLKCLYLDWWEIDGSGLERIIKSCTVLSDLQIATTFGLNKLMSHMINSFAGLSDLETLTITSAPSHNMATSTPKTKLGTTQVAKDLDLPEYLMEKLQEPDSTIPDTKDLRKFARRLPNFKLFRWTGRGGKGQWEFTKPNTIVHVTFTHAAILTKSTWEVSSLAAPSFAFEDARGTETRILELPVSKSTPGPAPTSSPLSRSSTLTVLKTPKTPDVDLPSIKSGGYNREWPKVGLNQRFEGLGITVEAEEPKSNGTLDQVRGHRKPKHGKPRPSDGKLELGVIPVSATPNGSSEKKPIKRLSLTRSSLSSPSPTSRKPFLGSTQSASTKSSHTISTSPPTSLGRQTALSGKSEAGAGLGRGVGISSKKRSISLTLNK